MTPVTSQSDNAARVYGLPATVFCAYLGHQMESYIKTTRLQQLHKDNITRLQQLHKDNITRLQQLHKVQVNNSINSKYFKV